MSKVKNDIWGNPFFQSLTPNGKIVWLYLINNKNEAPSGIYQVTVRTIQDNTRGGGEEIPEPEIESIMQYMVSKGRLLWKENYVGIVDQHQHNNYINNPKYQANIQKQLKHLPPNIVDEFYPVVIGNRLAIDRLRLVDDTNRLQSTSIPYKDKNKDKDNNKDNPPIIPPLPIVETAHNDQAREADRVYHLNQKDEDVSTSDSWEMWVSERFIKEMRREYGDNALKAAYDAINRKAIKLGAPITTPENYMRAVCISESKKLKGVTNGK
jgi:hypothetical protein